MRGKGTTTVLEVSGLQWATSKASVEATLSRRPGVLAVASSRIGSVTADTTAPDAPSPSMCATR